MGTEYLRNYAVRRLQKSYAAMGRHTVFPGRVVGYPRSGGSRQNRLACTTIPVGCVVLIAFLAVQVGVHPRTLGAFVLLSRFVGPSPITLGIPP